jgi:gentisate 1,2-dioxygenase
MDRNDAVAAGSAEARRAFYARIGALGMTPLWEVLGALVPPQPTSPSRPPSGATRRSAST